MQARERPYPHTVANLLHNATLARAPLAPQIKPPLQAVHVVVRHDHFALVVHAVLVLHDGVTPCFYGHRQVAREHDHHRPIRQVCHLSLSRTCPTEMQQALC